MAISLKSKVDFLFKKLGFNVTRTDSDSLKGATNESIPSPLVIRGDLTWNKAGAIPIAIPASNNSIVEVYGSNNLIETTNDGTASTNRTWLTGLTNWINPEFGATYQVKVYIHTSNDSDSAANISKQVFASGSGNNDEWFFDYSSGVLHFMGENLPNGVSFSGKSVYISGARYVGPLGLDEFVPNAMNESDQATVARHTKEIDQLRIDTDSDHLAFQLKIASIVGIGDSDLAASAQLRNDVDSLRLDVDSDTTFIQNLKSKQSDLKVAIDSDYALFQIKLSNVKGIDDSDLTVMATLRNEVDNLKLDRDSDTTTIQLLKTKQNELKLLIDSDYTLFQNKIASVQGIGDSDLTVMATLRNEVDSFDSEITNLNTKVISLMSDRDSDTIVIQDLNRRMNILEAAVGVTPSQPDATPIPTDSETLGIVQFSTDSDNVLENNITVTWRVVAGDGATVTINNVLFAKGMTDANVLQILYINIIDHPVANRYWEVFALRNGNKIEYAFKEKYSILGYTLTVAVTNSSDNASFVNTVPSS